jgi:hypothetical protein
MRGPFVSKEIESKCWKEELGKAGELGVVLLEMGQSQ